MFCICTCTLRDQSIYIDNSILETEFTEPMIAPKLTLMVENKWNTELDNRESNTYKELSNVVMQTVSGAIVTR